MILPLPENAGIQGGARIKEYESINDNEENGR